MYQRYYFRINGLHTDACRLKVTRALQQVSEIKVLEIDLETGMAVIESKVAAEIIESIIDAEGYNAILIPD